MWGGGRDKQLIGALVSRHKSNLLKTEAYRRLVTWGVVPMLPLNYGKHSLYYYGATIWNSLPASVIETDSLNSFILNMFNYCMYVYVLILFVCCPGHSWKKAFADAVSLFK